MHPARPLALALTLALGTLSAAARAAAPAASETIDLRGLDQTLHVYGQPGGPAAVVTSGDGGWIHLGPDVAELLASQGWYVIGFDARAYLSGFTSRSGPLSPEDVPRDYLALVQRAAARSPRRPVLVGVSEGAGLSVLAATSPEVQERISGVVGLGLPDRNELGWRWRDALIYVTKKTPNEPLFSVRERVAQVSPAPLAVINSTHDEFVPVAEVQAIMAQARPPSRLWLVEASNHRFSGGEPDFHARLAEALAWIAGGRPGRP